MIYKVVLVSGVWQSCLVIDIRIFGASLMAQQVKNSPAMPETQEMWVQFLDQEDPLEEGHGNPLQYSCLENPMDCRAWWATVQRVTQSQTQLSD